MRNTINMVLSFLKNNKGILAGIIASVLAVMFSLLPQLGNTIYANGLYQVIRVIIDNSLALLPFPTIGIFLIALPFFLYFYFKKHYTTCRSLVVLPLNLIGGIIALFLVMWGYNYTHPNYFSQLYSREMTVTDLYEFGQNVVQSTNNSRLDSNGLSFSFDDNELRTSVESFCEEQNIPTIGRVQCKEIYLNGLMRKLGIAGIYMPFTGESYCDGTFPDVVKVFIKAHEMSHGYSVTDEGEADYFAYKSLLAHSENYNFIYAANLELLRSIRSQLYRINDSLRKELDTKISIEVMNDIKAIRANALMHQEFIPGLQSEFNDKYLKMLGVTEGVKSYDRFVEIAWHNR